MATSNEVGCIDIWNMYERKRIHSLSQHKQIASDIKWMNTNSAAFVSCSIDKTIKIWKDYKVVEEIDGQDNWLRSLWINDDDSLLISGCVQGKAIGFDLPTCQERFKINVGDNTNQMNTVNSVNVWQDKGLISVGSRDGVCRFYDTRTPLNPIYSQKAHAKGINKIDYSKINDTFYTSGRDNKINIWDIRCLRERKSSHTNIVNRDDNFKESETISECESLQTLSNHVCQTHHIQSGYMQNSRYIITGSEENMIYIYSAENGSLIKNIATDSSMVPIQSPIPDSSSMGFVYCGIHTNIFHVFKPMSKQYIEETNGQNKNDNDLDLDGDAVNLMSSIMSRHSDLIQRLVYQNQLLHNYRSWEEFLSFLISQQQNDPQITELVSNIMEFISQSGSRETQFQQEKRQQEKRKKYDSLKPICKICEKSRTVSQLHSQICIGFNINPKINIKF